VHGRESLDAGTVASGASIKAGEPGEALHREALDAGYVCAPSTCPAASGADQWGVLGSGIKHYRSHPA
jgi:hypothetical protein